MLKKTFAEIANALEKGIVHVTAMTTATVIGWLLAYRYVILFPLVVIEGPIVTILAGFLASLGQFNLFICYPLIVVADVIGDLFMYAQGRWGGKPAVERWGHHFGIKPEIIVRLEEHFKKHPGKTLIFGKISHFFGGPVLIAAGMARMPLSEIPLVQFSRNVAEIARPASARILFRGSIREIR